MATGHAAGHGQHVPRSETLPDAALQWESRGGSKGTVCEAAWVEGNDKRGGKRIFHFRGRNGLEKESVRDGFCCGDLGTPEFSMGNERKGG